MQIDLWEMVKIQANSDFKKSSPINSKNKFENEKIMCDYIWEGVF